MFSKRFASSSKWHNPTSQTYVTWAIIQAESIPEYHTGHEYLETVSLIAQDINPWNKNSSFYSSTITSERVSLRLTANIIKHERRQSFEVFTGVFAQTVIFKHGTRSEEHNRREHNALTTAHVRMRGTYTCNSSSRYILYLMMATLAETCVTFKLKNFTTFKFISVWT
jgi:hypothetical protein